MSEQTENETDCSGISMPQVENKSEVTNGEAGEPGGTSPVPDATTPRPPPQKPTPPQPPPASAPPDVQPGDQAATPDRMKRDFLRGNCHRVNCRFKHDTTNKKLSNCTLMFCHDYQNTKCVRPSCQYIHGTRTEEANFYATGELLVKDETCTKQPACHDYLRQGFCLTKGCSYRHISLAEYNKEKNGSQTTPPPLPIPMPNFTYPPPVRPPETAGIPTDVRVPPPSIPKHHPLGPLPGYTNNYSKTRSNGPPEPINGNSSNLNHSLKRPLVSTIDGTIPPNPLITCFSNKRPKSDGTEKCKNCEALESRITKLEDKIESVWPKYRDLKKENENLKIVHESLLSEMSKRNTSAALASLQNPISDANLRAALIRLLFNPNQDSPNIRLNMPIPNSSIDLASILARANTNLPIINAFALAQAQVQTPQNQPIRMAQQIQNNPCQAIGSSIPQQQLLHTTNNQQAMQPAIGATVNHQNQNQQLPNQQVPPPQFPIMAQQNQQQQQQLVSENNYFGNQTQQLVQQNAPNNTLQNILLQ